MTPPSLHAPATIIIIYLLMRTLLCMANVDLVNFIIQTSILSIGAIDLYFAFAPDIMSNELSMYFVYTFHYFKHYNLKNE